MLSLCTRWLHVFQPVSSIVQMVLPTHRHTSASSNWCFSVNRPSASPASCCALSKDSFTSTRKALLAVSVAVTLKLFYTPCHKVALSNRPTTIHPSVCPSLGYRHAGFLQLAGHQGCADLSADRQRSASSRTAIGRRYIVSLPRGDNLL